MSYTYLQEQGEESSAVSFADIPAFVLSRLNHIADKSSCRDSETDCSQGSRYGTTSGRLTAHPGADGLTSLRVDSLARTSASQVKEQESPESEADSGKKWQGSFTRYDRDLHSWKTRQCLLDGDLESFSETWPKWGIMRSGECWAHTMSAHLTSGTESGFSQQIPTPTVHGNYNRKGASKNSGDGLATHVKHWPTPTCQEVEHQSAELTETGRRKSKTSDSSHSLNLADSVKVWPTTRAGNPGSRRPGTGGKVLSEEAKKASFQTPCAQDYRRRGPNSNQQGLPEQIHKMQHWATPRKFMYKDSTTDRGKCNLGEQIQGQLNPDWVEWLMGWPIGWTRLESIKLDWRDWSVDPADTGEIARTGTGIKNRVNRLKAIGNGQVPAVVRLAWNFLQGEHEKGRVRDETKPTKQ